MLATNFEYEYNGVKSIMVSDDNFWPYYGQGSKHRAILELFNRGFLKEKELYWFHDLDAFQSEVITEAELEMGEVDMALTDYGWREKWNTGSIFFTSKAEDIFSGIVEIMSLFKSKDENALMALTNNEYDYGKWIRISDLKVIEKIPRVRDVNRRIKHINTSYNFFPLFKTQHCYETAIKPIKIVHFHPFARIKSPFTNSLLDFYMYGKNETKTVFMSKRLIKIFHQHGVK